MANWGAFAGGIADGYESAEKLRLQKEREGREAEEFDEKKKAWALRDQGMLAIRAASNTVDPSADPATFMTQEQLEAKFAQPEKKGWFARQFSSDPTPAAPPVAAKDDIASKYNTPLNTEQEKRDYEAWKSGLPTSMDRSGKDYDLTGAFMKGLAPGEDGHLPDTYKKPNHPTFSNESVYSGKDHGVGGKWAQDDKGKWTFEASEDQLKHISAKEMQEYIRNSDPDTTLVIPSAKERGAFAAAGGKEKPASKDDYVPVTLSDGRIFYAPRDKVKRDDSPEAAIRAGKAIMQFDPERGTTLMKLGLELKKGNFEDTALQMQQGFMAATRVQIYDPMKAAEMLSKLYDAHPDGSNMKLYYDADKGKYVQQFFVGGRAVGKPKELSWHDITLQAEPLLSADGIKDSLTRAAKQIKDDADRVIDLARLDEDKKRTRIMQGTAAREAAASEADNKVKEARARVYNARAADLRKNSDGTYDFKFDEATGRMMRVKQNAGPKDHPDYEDNEWRDFVRPEFLGRHQELTTFAASKGLVAKPGTDGRVWYFNPKTGMRSLSPEAAITLKPPAAKPSASNPANGSAQVPAPSF